MSSGRSSANAAICFSRFGRESRRLTRRSRRPSKSSGAALRACAASPAMVLSCQNTIAKTLDSTRSEWNKYSTHANKRFARSVFRRASQAALAAFPAGPGGRRARADRSCGNPRMAGRAIRNNHVARQKSAGASGRTDMKSLVIGLATADGARRRRPGPGPAQAGPRHRRDARPVQRFVLDGRQERRRCRRQGHERAGRLPGARDLRHGRDEPAHRRCRQPEAVRSRGVDRRCVRPRPLDQEGGRRGHPGHLDQFRIRRVERPRSAASCRVRTRSSPGGPRAPS